MTVVPNTYVHPDESLFALPVESIPKFDFAALWVWIGWRMSGEGARQECRKAHDGFHGSGPGGK